MLTRIKHRTRKMEPQIQKDQKGNPNDFVLLFYLFIPTWGLKGMAHMCVLSCWDGTLLDLQGQLRFTSARNSLSRPSRELLIFGYCSFIRKKKRFELDTCCTLVQRLPRNVQVSSDFGCVVTNPSISHVKPSQVHGILISINKM